MSAVTAMIPKSSLDKAETDIYRMNVILDDDDDDGSEGTEFVQEVYDDGNHPATKLQQPNAQNQQHIQSQQPRQRAAKDHFPEQLNQALQQDRRPPPIATEWSASAEQSADPIILQDDDEISLDIVQQSERTAENSETMRAMPSALSSASSSASSMLHFQDPKRAGSMNVVPPTQAQYYPAQRLRSEIAGTGPERYDWHDHRPETHRHPRLARTELSRDTIEDIRASAEATPAFLRRAAQDRMASNAVRVPPSPTSLTGRREKVGFSSMSTFTSSSSNVMDMPPPDTSFCGADASALDGTFVSVRDLNDDDDVPSVDNEQDFNGGAQYFRFDPNGKDLNGNASSRSGSEAGYPDETTSLLGRRKLPWQGGFFGSEVEKEDRRERLRMMRVPEGWLAGWLWTVRSFLDGCSSGTLSRASPYAEKRSGRLASPWSRTADLSSRHDFRLSPMARQRVFSNILMVVLWFHLALCGLHDLFLQYLSYRNPEEDGAGVSWNGEGRYVPDVWITWEGLVFNPAIGPGARTLTAFGALVPGLVLSKNQGWRVGTALLQSSSVLQLFIHSLALKYIIGGPLVGLEWKRGTFTVTIFYFISAMVGLTWSMALEPGRLITASDMGVSGLLAAAILEQSLFPLASKDDDVEPPSRSVISNTAGRGANATSSSSNENFTFEPATSRKKRLCAINLFGPTLLTLEIILAWWAAYTSLVGVIAAAFVGASCSVFIFLGNVNEHGDTFSNHDLSFTETPPPPPPPFADRGWGDDDSADTSVGGSRPAFNTPLMRRSILGDDDDEEEPLGSRSLRKRKNDLSVSFAKTPGIKGKTISINPEKKKLSLSRVIVRVMGIVLALLLTLIPASLVATGDDPSKETTRASVLGCKPMRSVYRQNENSNFFECAGGCIPLSRSHVAKHKEGMRDGRCDSIGYRCWHQAGEMILQGYEVDVGVYVLPSSDGSCRQSTERQSSQTNNDDINAGTFDGEIEGT